MDDVNRLVEQTLAGDSKAYGRIVALHQRKIYGFLIKLTMNREDAEDLLQETFIRAYNYLYRFDPKYQFSTWLYQIALNTFRRHAKKKSTRTTIDLDEIAPIPSSGGEEPERSVETRENCEELLRILSQLPDEQRMALTLKYFHGYQFKEVGQVMKISAEAAKMKVQRAKETILKKYSLWKKGGNLHEVS